MALQIRRVVTGHDANGRAVVKIDEIAKNITSSRPQQSAVVIWTTEGFPVNPGTAMPSVNGCRKQDYTVLIVVGLPVTH